MKAQAKRSAVCAGLLAVLTCGGCLSGLAGGGESALDRDASRPYPSLEKEPSLPVQVLRDVTRIRLTNTSARAFGASTMWLNGRYSREIEGLAIGQTMTLELESFRDEFGERFRGGGFFATVDPDPLIMAEIESEGKLYGLVVVGDLYE